MDATDSVAQWQAEKLDDMIRSLQPGIMIKDRLHGGGQRGKRETSSQYEHAEPVRDGDGHMFRESVHLGQAKRSAHNRRAESAMVIPDIMRGACA